MSDEVVTPEVPAEVPAPEQAATAAPETAEAQAPENAEQQAPKTFTQEELDAAIGKRLAKERRKWDRENQQRAAPAPQQPVGDLKLEQFATPEEYAEALAERKAQEKLAQQEAARQQEELLSTYHEREEDARTKYDDFEQVAYNPRLSITPHMAQAIQAAENGPEIAYFLGQNPKDADRIARLSPFLQAKEIGRLEAKLAAEPPTKLVTKAPPPINPVSPKTTGIQTYDLDDPRSYAQLGPAAWLEARKQKAIQDARARRS